VRDKLFLRNYEHRPSATQVLSRDYSRQSNSIEIKTDVLTATVSLSTDRCFPGQELGVALEVDLKPGWHIYGDP
jgi:DsbC/DsbD-like thiol-disulfide interchange protein